VVARIIPEPGGYRVEGRGGMSRHALREQTKAGEIARLLLAAVEGG
jgi:hypothetical protein